MIFYYNIVGYYARCPESSLKGSNHWPELSCSFENLKCHLGYSIAVRFLSPGKRQNAVMMLFKIEEAEWFWLVPVSLSPPAPFLCEARTHQVSFPWCDMVFLNSLSLRFSAWTPSPAPCPSWCSSVFSQYWLNFGAFSCPPGQTWRCTVDSRFCAWTLTPRVCLCSLFMPLCMHACTRTHMYIDTCTHFLSRFFCFVCLFRATPKAYGSSQVRGWIGATAYSVHQAMQNLSHTCDLYHSSQQCRVLNPQSKARDWTRVLMDTNRVHYFWATAGTPV